MFVVFLEKDIAKANQAARPVQFVKKSSHAFPEWNSGT